MFDYSIANRSLVFFILFIAAADTKTHAQKTSTTTELEPKTSFERSLECWFIEI